MAYRLLSFSWIGPLVFVAAIIIFGAMNPGYSHVSQFVSELGANDARVYYLMNWFGIVPFGLSIMLFSVGAYGFMPNWLGKTAFVVLALTGFLFVTAGIFNCDEGCSFSDMSQSAIIHNLSAFSAFALAIVSQLLLGLLTFSRKPDPAHVYSLTSAVLGIVLFYLIMRAGIYSDFRGLFQRFFLFNFLIWLILTGRDLKRAI